ncbi:catalase family protein [Pacificimonas flava]|uniref:Catalase n=1 Tax=Pacificimonas flava TaxID=1234595 RepID=M2U764_9SPHN|nr:catalase family protein [Pacificimonas flava]EMD83837.1 Catalase [Pacificimonas flava]MBB5281185.1 hypothetical protein [Pacificimonas flava]
MRSSAVPFTPAVETPREDEEETIAELNETFDRILERTAEDYDHAVRAVHAKAHGILAGELTVRESLPPELAQGLFAAPGTYGAVVRLSTNAGDILPDAISLPRGLALKIVDVPGERLPNAEGRAQDFVMVNGSTFQTKDADSFLKNLKMLAHTTDRLEGTKKAMSAALRGVNTALESVGIESAAVQAMGGAPNVDPLGETYYSVTPFRYGEYIAKFALVPTAPAMRALSGRKIEIEGRENAIREEIREEMRGMDAEWDFRVQLCRDLERQPVEDPTVEWDEEEAPFETVATLRVPAQDSWQAERVETVNEQMRFSIWTGLAAHRPLGNINRARRAPYRHSADFRAAANGCPYHEPGAAAGV